MEKTIYTKKYEEFLNILIKTRLENKITQKKLGDILNKPQSFVSKYENKERKLDIIEAIYISKALNIEILEIIKKLK